MRIPSTMAKHTLIEVENVVKKESLFHNIHFPIDFCPFPTE